MKVCFITNRLVLTDGSGRSSISIIKELKKQGIAVKVLLSHNAPESDLKDVEQYKILKSLKNYKAKWFYLLLDYFRTKRFMTDCDVIHAEIEPLAPLAYLLAKTAKKPYFLMVHGTFSIRPLKVWYLKGIFNKAYLGANKIFYNSFYTQSRFLKEVPAQSNEVIGRGVDLEKFNNFKPAVKTKEKIILSVGLIKRRKGYHISIPAVGQAAKKYPDLKYIIAGLNSNDDYFKELQGLVSKYNLEGKIEFKQDLTESALIDLYYAADIFLLTSVNFDDRFEGLGMVYLEANAAGVPVIGTYDCGAENAIKDGYNGLLVPQNDIAAVARAILKLLDDPVLAKKMGENGKAMVQDLSWKKVVEKIITNYHKT